jgi:hypothetical protein
VSDGVRPRIARATGLKRAALYNRQAVTDKTLARSVLQQRGDFRAGGRGRRAQV